MATTDVTEKVFAGNEIKNGTAVVTAQKTGSFQDVDPEITSGKSETQWETDLGGRYDDVRYYTGDSA